MSRKGEPPRPNLKGPRERDALPIAPNNGAHFKDIAGIGCWADRQSKGGLSEDDE
ncbi:hypothetical protein PAXINDRAFT_21403 [Paxillus involutus ATCC 200175]|uniref:Uncharacterized protein n=1 Tax=Paxillus involutus ATCC 200175 TaxID=664439 RepID=A0A0C9TAT2_PAXIN|nr:hypothetical protein PAXINDRAFT_21403 [Paxillus involutus ATCC 200175]